MPAMGSPSTESVAFGWAIRRRRRALDLSQQALAKRAGMNFKHLGEIERGQGNPRLRTILLLIEALELSPDEFATLWGEARRLTQRDGRH
jgi:transcriptional regulator with XRE-family HTH domain